ncbi:MAG: sulfotransferase family protein [Gemmatimonadota bacterium]
MSADAHHNLETLDRSRSPVFTIGSPRSGTTLLYSMLLSAGGFAHLRTETHVFNSLAPRFGDMKDEESRRGALDVWFRSDVHTLTGLAESEVRGQIERHARGPGDFLRLIMEAIARRQGVIRWAETTPDHILHVDQIARELPEALFIHVIRDGRDVAASMARQGWVRPFALDRARPALAAAAYWGWLVEEGRRAGSRIPGRYLEVRYESLVERPVETLTEIGSFISHDLDWERIQRVGVGSVGRPNTSFAGSGTSFIGRWRTELSTADARDVDNLLQPTLRELGYVSEGGGAKPLLALRGLAYRGRFRIRQTVKRHRLFARRLTDLGFFAPGSMKVTSEKLRDPGAQVATGAEPSTEGQG